MYGALDESGNRVGNPIKASRLGEFAGIPNIEKQIERNRAHLKDLDRRKHLAGRIRAVVRDCQRTGSLTRTAIEDRLAEKGISAVFRINDGGRLTGATFIDHRNKDVYNGSNLGKDLSANEWHKLFTLPPEERPEQIRETRGPEAMPVVESATDAPGPEALPDAPEPVVYEDVEEDVYENAQDTTGRRTTWSNSHGLGLIDALLKQGDSYEEIDPEFRSLYKRRKKKGKRIKR